MLGVEFSELRPSILIEIASGREIEVDKVIRECVIVLEGVSFKIDLIPFGQGSFDVVVGMNWLARRKAEVVCHEKVVLIPLENGNVLRVQGKSVEKDLKTLMSTKTKEL